MKFSLRQLLPHATLGQNLFHELQLSSAPQRLLQTSLRYLSSLRLLTVPQIPIKLHHIQPAPYPDSRLALRNLPRGINSQGGTAIRGNHLLLFTHLRITQIDLIILLQLSFTTRLKWVRTA